MMRSSIRYQHRAEEGFRLSERIALFLDGDLEVSGGSGDIDIFAHGGEGHPFVVIPMRDTHVLVVDTTHGDPDRQEVLR